MGRMKSLGYAYAEYLQDENDPQIDVDQYFEDIVHGEVEIPKWFVDEWLIANPIFASEEFSAEESYEVIMVNVNHSMERDGETFVFGDVMFALPNNGRSRISSFGQGPDKPSARQSLIDRAVDYLVEEEFNAEYDEEDMVSCRHCWNEIGNEKEVYGDETVEYEMANGELVCVPCYKRWMDEYKNDLDPHYTPFYAESEDLVYYVHGADDLYGPYYSLEQAQEAVERLEQKGIEIRGITEGNTDNWMAETFDAETNFDILNIEYMEDGEETFDYPESMLVPVETRKDDHWTHTKDRIRVKIKSYIRRNFGNDVEVIDFLAFPIGSEYALGQEMNAENFDVEFEEWGKQEMKTHGKNVSFKDWLEEESKSHGNVPITDWAEHEEKSHDARYGAETFDAEHRILSYVDGHAITILMTDDEATIDNAEEIIDNLVDEHGFDDYAEVGEGDKEITIYFKDVGGNTLRTLSYDVKGNKANDAIIEWFHDYDYPVGGYTANAETFEASNATDFYRNCNQKGWSVLGRTMHYGCNVFGKVVGGGVVVANTLNFYDKGGRVLRTAGTNNNFPPALELAKVSRELQPDSIGDWSRVAQVTNERLSQNFSAETKSWRIQNRDSSGKFTKGFVEEIDIADFMELEPEAIPEISVEMTYTPEQTVDFVNSMINDDDLPTRLIDSSFVNTLQSHVSSADLEMLQALNDAANMAAFEALMNGSAENQQAASRAVFVTDMLMNYKWGQDYWASEWE